jgi:hypothetical protein
MVHRNRHADGVVVSTAPAARHAASFNDMTMDTSDGEGHHVAVVGGANASGAVSTTMHGDARSPMGVASMTVADSSRLSTLRLTVLSLVPPHTAHAHAHTYTQPHVYARVRW